MADLSLNGFQESKTILRNLSFVGEFLGAKIIEDNIKPYHIRSLSWENHTFKQEGQYHGPGILFTFPVLDRGETGAYTLRITMEEDRYGTVANFIEFLKALIINEFGVYRSVEDIKKSLKFRLTLLTFPEQVLEFGELYFLTAESTESSYGDTEIKTYTISFAYDNFIRLK